MIRSSTATRYTRGTHGVRMGALCVWAAYGDGRGTDSGDTAGRALEARREQAYHSIAAAMRCMGASESHSLRTMMR